MWSSLPPLRADRIYGGPGWQPNHFAALFPTEISEQSDQPTVGVEEGCTEFGVGTAKSEESDGNVGRIHEGDRHLKIEDMGRDNSDQGWAEKGSKLPREKQQEAQAGSGYVVPDCGPELKRTDVESTEVNHHVLY